MLSFLCHFLQGRDPILLANTNCQYDIEWQTEYACDAASLTSRNCKLNNAVHGVDVDLTPLTRDLDGSGECISSKEDKILWS